MSTTSGTLATKILRPDVQILRGVAVLAVVLYHFDFPWLNGGFLGVDMFFVISGYVITQTLLRSSGSTSQRIKQFYVRRAKRILPAAIFVSLITLLASTFFFPSSYLSRHVGDALGSIFMVSNGLFWHQSLDYFNQNMVPSPFLHYWSLAVEEQFYLVWPLVLILIVRNRKWIVYVAIPFTFALAMITTASRPVFSYYSPSSRAWEFLLGAVILFLPRIEFAHWARKILVAVFFLCLVASFIIITGQEATPGVTTALPVLSTAGLIYVGFNSTFLSPLHWVGDISYSLYLVHWPLIVFFNAFYVHLSVQAQIAIFVLSLILAKIMSLFVEYPFRFENWRIAGRKICYALSATSTVVLLLATLNGFHASDRGIKMEVDRSESPIYSTECHTQLDTPVLKNCFFGDLASPKTVMLVGDSHAVQYFKGLEVAAETAKYKLLNSTKSACPAVLLGNRISNRDRSCYVWQERLIDAIKQVKPSILVLSNFTERRDGKFELGITPQEYVQAQTAFIKQVQKYVGRIVYVGDSPFAGFFELTCLQNNPKHLSRCDIPNTKTRLSQEIEKTITALGVKFLDSRDFLCVKEICPAVLDNKNVYRDATHIAGHIYKRVAKGLIPIFSTE